VHVDVFVPVSEEGAGEGASWRGKVRSVGEGEVECFCVATWEVGVGRCAVVFVVRGPIDGR
jgi:hypothetical protein